MGNKYSITMHFKRCGFWDVFTADEGQKVVCGDWEGFNLQDYRENQSDAYGWIETYAQSEEFAGFFLTEAPFRIEIREL